MPDLLVRPATLDDIAAVTAIYRPAVLEGTASFEYDPPDDVEMRRRFAAITAAGYPYLVAELDAGVAGYAYVSAYRPRAAYRYCVENSVYIAPDAHRRGVGRALLAALITRCTKAGYRQMIGIIGDSGHNASIRLHEALGFVHAGLIRSVGWKHGRWLDQVIMQRALGPGDTLAAPQAMV